MHLLHRFWWPALIVKQLYTCSAIFPSGDRIEFSKVYLGLFEFNDKTSQRTQALFTFIETSIRVHKKNFDNFVSTIGNELSAAKKFVSMVER